MTVEQDSAALDQKIADATVTRRTRMLFRALTITASVAALFILLLLGWQISKTQDLAAADARILTKEQALIRQGSQSHTGLCAVKKDLKQRVAETKKFLREHPSGIPGIPNATLIGSMHNQERTIAALGNLACTSDNPNGI